MPSAPNLQPSHEDSLQDGQVTDLNRPPPQMGDSDGSSIDKQPGLSKRMRLSNFTSRTKAKTKKLLKVDGTAVDVQSEGEEDRFLDSLEHDPAFNPSQLVKSKSSDPHGTSKTTLGTIHSIAASIKHPVEAIKSKATRTTAGQLSKTERPYLSKKADLEYLEAHDNLQCAESTASSRRATSDDELDSVIGDHTNRILEMKKHRESLRVAWTTGRHVRRVRVVPKEHIQLPRNENLMKDNVDGGSARFDWLSWLGYNLIYYTQDFSAQYIDDFDELPFSIDSSRHYVERLVMASAPWQSWAMEIRAVYRWEDPRVTGKWFALYLFLWYTNHVVGFLYFYIIYIVLKNRFYPTSVESLRVSMRKAHDSRATASKFGELIDKHGRDDWLGPMMEDLGPYIQLQLGDMANMLEVFSNFYHWKHPKKTRATLLFFASCLAVTLFTDMAFCVKMVWFIFGGVFFLCWPISSHFPKYRYLASPIKWALWEIPTHAEWSFLYLRSQAQLAREDLINGKIEGKYMGEVQNSVIDPYFEGNTALPRIRVGDDKSGSEALSDDEGWYSASSSTSVLGASDIRSFRASYQGTIGRLIVYSGGIRLVRRMKQQELWDLPFHGLAEMRKVEGSKSSKLISSPDQLELESVEGRIFSLGAMKERDEAFNTIIGFSGLQWQSLQIRHKTNAQEL